MGRASALGGSLRIVAMARKLALLVSKKPAAMRLPRDLARCL